MSGDQLDVEAYAALYSGRTKIMRLLFIASKSKNPTVQLDTLRMAYDEIKKGENTQLFREVVQKINGRLGPDYEMDLIWCEGIDRKAEQKKERLENELNAYRVFFSFHAFSFLLLFKLCFVGPDTFNFCIVIGWNLCIICVLLMLLVLTDCITFRNLVGLL